MLTLNFKLVNKTGILMTKILKLLYLLMFFSCFSLEGKEEDEPDVSTATKADDSKTKEAPPKIGNFALPSSQQPAALFGFGGNIIDEGEVQLNVFSDAFRGKDRTVIDVIPGVLFGVTDTFSIYFNFPFTPKFQDREHHSSGFEDFFFQFEYAFYNKSTFTYTDQATVVANITVPTGSIKKNPPTGFGAPGFFVGGTYYHTTVEWVFFTAQGAILTTSNHKSKIGDFFLYQFGIVRNIPSPEGFVYACQLELDGQYQRKNRLLGKIDPNSGGNAIYVTPSLWISSKEIAIQFGVSVPVNQNLFGNQRKFDYALNFNLAWSFY